MHNEQREIIRKLKEDGIEMQDNRGGEKINI